MLAPHELKNKSFSKSVRGYTATEVDDHIDFLVEKYTELYRENTELNKKLRVVATKLDEIKDEEESIRSTLVNAQKMGEKIIRDANDKADVITGAIKTRCDSVIADFKREITREKEDIWRIRTGVLDFKQSVFDLYVRHIAELQGISVNQLDEIVLPNEGAIVENILNEVASAVKNDGDAELEKAKSEDLNLNAKTDAADELPDEIDGELPASSDEGSSGIISEELLKTGEDQFIKNLEKTAESD